MVAATLEWTTDDVANWLIEAARTAHRLPPVRVQGHFNCWPILYGWRDGADHFWCGARDQGDVWNVKKPAKNDLQPRRRLATRP